jgi:hypothetical protein
MARSVRPDRDRGERTDGRAEPGPETPRPAPGIAAVMRMQTLLGNQATRRLLARAPVPEMQPAGEKSAEDERVMTIAGIGEYKVSSLQLGGKKTVTVTFNAGSDAQRLFLASSQGDPIPSVTIHVNRVVVTLTEVLISSFQIADEPGGEPLVTIQLDGATRTVK